MKTAAMCCARGSGILAICADANLRAAEREPCLQHVDCGSLNQSPPILVPSAFSCGLVRCCIQSLDLSAPNCCYPRIRIAGQVLKPCAFCFVQRASDVFIDQFAAFLVQAGPVFVGALYRLQPPYLPIHLIRQSRVARIGEDLEGKFQAVIG